MICHTWPLSSSPLSPCPLNSSHTGLFLPWISQAWFHFKAFKLAVPSAQNALPPRSLYGCLHPKSQISADYSIYTSSASKQAAHLFLGIKGSSSPGVIKVWKPLVILSLADNKRYKSNQDYTGQIVQGLHTVLYMHSIFFFFTGYFQSFVTTVWCGEPLQCQTAGAAKDHQPPCAAAKTTVLSLSEKQPECKASTFYALCNLWFHCQGQLLL